MYGGMQFAVSFISEEINFICYTKFNCFIWPYQLSSYRIKYSHRLLPLHDVQRTTSKYVWMYCFSLLLRLYWSATCKRYSCYKKYPLNNVTNNLLNQYMYKKWWWFYSFYAIFIKESLQGLQKFMNLLSPSHTVTFRLLRFATFWKRSETAVHVANRSIT
jgi:hypothetical protein